MSRRGDAGTAQETASWKKLRGAERSNTSSGEWRPSPDMSRSYGRSDTGICIASTRMRCSFSKELWLDLVWNIMNESLKEIG